MITDVATRCAVVWWPDWPVVAALGERGDIGQVQAAVFHANRVIAASPSARVDGVHVGQPRRDAQRACPLVVVLDHHPERDARAFEPVLHSLEEMVPMLEATEPGLCTFATRGPSRYFGGDEELALKAARAAAAAVPVDWLRVAGPPVVGCADGAFAAITAARTSRHRAQVVPSGESALFLSTFPITELARSPARLPGMVELADLLTRLGIRRLGELAALPRADVSARFGPTGELAHRLACGLEARPPVGRRPPPDLVVQVTFEQPVPTSGPVAFAAKQLGDELVGRLRALGLACTSLAVLAETDHGERHERQWRHDLAFGPTTIAERVRWQLDGWASSLHPPTAGITLLRLTPVEVVAAVGVQEGFWGGRSQADERATRGVARLVGLLGADAVLVPEWQGGRHHDESYLLVPAATTDLLDRLATTAPGAEPWPGRLPTPSPVTLRDDEVEVLDDASVPVKVSGRGMISASPRVMRDSAGHTHRIVNWAGPWPVDDRWWDTHRRRRLARCQILLESGVAHLIVVENGAWRLAASYD